MSADDDVEKQVRELCREARAAGRRLAQANTAAKNAALRAAAAGLRTHGARLLEANARDLSAAGSLSAAFRDRLALSPERIETMARGVEEVLALPDPVGDSIAAWRRPNGLEIRQVRIPIGVIAILYESRPNVTADAAALCLKSGNAAILKGGSEALHTNAAIADLFLAALDGAELPPAAVQLLRTKERAATRALLRQNDLVDVIVPRGGKELIRAIETESTIPVIKHLEGVCQLYVDRAADLAQAGRICVNAKAQRPGVCNAIENLLVHRDIAEEFLPRMVRALEAEGVEVRGCAETRRIVSTVRAASEEDWATEYLDKILSVKVVDSMEDALEFIERYGSGLADAIVTEDYSAARRFLAAVDSAAVFVNASTRFTDGFEFGFGAEIGISTNRLHARGPMGLRELTTYKYLVLGAGQVRE
ncbi:MAG: glutamate-5-semialdehyde dehydrogenase [Deltaproteobacteria bacterium]|nr:glutamate-5-semialdehyde dehydrogenase [Deltaproteobacteria bacterium]